MRIRCWLVADGVKELKLGCSRKRKTFNTLNKLNNIWCVVIFCYSTHGHWFHLTVGLYDISITTALKTAVIEENEIATDLIYI